MANTVQTQYMAMVPLRLFDWNSISEFNEETQLDILEKTCHHPLCQKYPASASYQQAFIKALMTKSERAGHEVAGDLYVAYTEVLDRRSDASAAAAVGMANMAYRIYCAPGQAPCNNYRCVRPIVLREADSFVSQGTTGLQTWTAAVCLVEWLLFHPAFFAGKEVLELGCGIGLVGSALMCWCLATPPSCILLTDHHPSVLRQLTDNMALNAAVGTEIPVRCDQESIPSTSQPAASETPSPAPAQTRASDRCSDTAQSSECPCLTHAQGSDFPCVRVSELNWCESAEEGSASHSLVSRVSPDVIFAADVVFDKAIIPSLVSTLRALLTHSRRLLSPAPVAVVCCTIRNQDTFDCFLTSLDTHQLVWQDLQLAERQLWCDRSCAVRLLHITTTTDALVTECETG